MSDTQLKLRGFTKVQIVDSTTGTVVGDSGWKQNKITETGFQYMAVGGASGNTPITAEGLGLGYFTNTNFTSTQLDFDSSPAVSNARILVTNANCSSEFVATSNGAILRFQATWLAASNWISQDSTINGIGIFNNTSNTANADINANKMLAGTTFAESAWSQDQEVRATYELKFSQ
jgi:hypothetical protein